MLFALFILIQSQEPPRLSKLVIAAAVLFLIVGVSLLVYFLRRLKSAEKEAEEDWSLSRRSLFVEPSARSEQKAAEESMVEAQRSERIEAERIDPEKLRPVKFQPEKIEPAATEYLSSPQRSETRMLVSEPVIEEPPAPAQP